MCSVRGVGRLGVAELCAEWEGAVVQPLTPPVGTSRDEAAGADLVAAMERAWATLLPRANALADDITWAMVEADREWYDAAPAELRAEIRASTREHVRRGLWTMAGVPLQEGRAIDLWRETGRRRARQGVPMELVLKSCSHGTRVLWEAMLWGRGTQELPDEVVIRAGQRMWGALEVQIATVVDAYRREQARLQRHDLQREINVLDGLLVGRGGDPGFLAEANEVLGLGRLDRVTCVVVLGTGDVPPSPRSPEERLERSGMRSWWHAHEGASVGLVRLGNREIDDVVSALADAPGRIGVAPVRDGLGELASAYRLARQVATIRRTPGPSAVIDALPELLVASAPQVAYLLVSEVLGGLLAEPDPHRGILVDTLRALLAHNGSATHAARELYCHRNTVIYRMRQIEAGTARRISDARDRLVLTLALMALDQQHR